MLEYIVLGIIQGIAEWLPISSEGAIVLARTRLFAHSASLEAAIHEALFLHLGTFFAALIYFRRDVKEILRGLKTFAAQPRESKNLISFLGISTLVSGCLGLGLLKLFTQFVESFETPGRWITLLVGLLLLGTACLELKARKDGYRTLKQIRWTDSLLLGVVQGCAALPGLSRSGLTVSTLLLRKFDKALSLKLSFLMSLPIVLGGNILLNLTGWVWSKEAFVGLLFSFVFGLATIHLLIKLAQKINFGYFVMTFAVLTLLAAAL